MKKVASQIHDLKFLKFSSIRRLSKFALIFLSDGNIIIKPIKSSLVFMNQTERNPFFFVLVKVIKSKVNHYLNLHLHVHHYVASLYGQKVGIIKGEQV